MTVLLENQTANQQSDIGRIRETADQLLSYTGWTDGELSILLVDDPRITELNAAYRRKNEPTNVLSFPLLEEDSPEFPVLLGDIVISVETATREAGQRGAGLDAYLTVLLVHGLVHLLGFDHERGDEDAAAMAAEEVRLLKKLEEDNLVTPGTVNLIRQPF